jgi:hypothetical protein
MHSRSSSRLATVRCEFECRDDRLQSLRRREGRPIWGVVELDCLCEEAAIQEAKRDAVIPLSFGTRFISLLHHEPD